LLQTVKIVKKDEDTITRRSCLTLSKIKEILTKKVESKKAKKIINIAFFFAIMAIAGGAMNMLAVLSNGGRMPVFCEEIYFTGSDRHSHANENTRFKILCDWIMISGDERAIDSEIVRAMMSLVQFPIGGLGFSSPGDILIWIFYFPTLFLVLISISVIIYENIWQ